MEKLYEINVSGTPYYFGDLTTSSALSAHVSDSSIHQTSGEVEDMLTAYTYDKATIDEKVASGGTFDPANYYDKASTDALLNEKLDIIAFETFSGEVSSQLSGKASESDYEALSGIVSAMSIEIGELEASGVTSGTVQSMIDESISGKLDVNVFNTYSGVVASEMVSKAENSDLSAHTANTDIHVTAADKTAWSNKQDALTAGDNIIISGNVISTTVQYWCGNLDQWASISGSTDPNTIYMVHE